MQIKKRARSKAAKLEREEAILAAAEILLRQSGYDVMTMQAVATMACLGKGTLYLYFSSREALLLGVYGRLFDQWIDRFASLNPNVTGPKEFCQDFHRFYTDDPLFLQLAGFVIPLMEPRLDRVSYIKGKRAMVSRVKKLAGIVYLRLGMPPILAQKFVWGVLTIAFGTTQITMQSPLPVKDLPEDVIAFIYSASFETVFLNAALPLCVGMMQTDLKQTSY